MSATVQSRHSGSDSPSMWQSPNQPADRRATLRRCSMLLLPSPRARGTRFDQFVILIPLPETSVHHTLLVRLLSQNCDKTPPNDPHRPVCRPGSGALQESGQAIMGPQPVPRGGLHHPDGTCSVTRMLSRVGSTEAVSSPELRHRRQRLLLHVCFRPKEMPQPWGPEQPALRAINDVPPAPARGALVRHAVPAGSPRRLPWPDQCVVTIAALLSEPAEPMVAKAGRFAPPDGTVAAWAARSPPTRSSTAPG